MNIQNRIRLTLVSLVLVIASTAAAAAEKSDLAKISGTLTVTGEPLAGAEVELTFYKDQACYDLANKKAEALSAEERKVLESCKRALPKIVADNRGVYVAVDLEPGWYMITVAWTSDQTPRWHNSPFQGDWFVAHYRRNDPAKPFGFTAVRDAAEIKAGEESEFDLQLPRR